MTQGILEEIFMPPAAIVYRARFCFWPRLRPPLQSGPSWFWRWRVSSRAQTPEWCHSNRRHTENPPSWPHRPRLHHLRRIPPVLLEKQPCQI